ncbi:WD40 repeat-like protein [Neocallimastix lanati (nom. inval.)]|jgi:Prp8 binding protein|uniref:WD40 repeat-like protein n=1 Tax=Neocallimastix californiae TaxID=1754190 RepID=A0A1Y2DTY8_9FUNG|nr:WD40 repeat-like protein [Neocallimastix sp. JGI-2020a]ORY62741.1 WD40 repeat-like protein [Neocallimastix californiae]|eukprot:ORY62741.1 WD40 repeat-like protein [Neocallimastix californiae]
MSSGALIETNKSHNESNKLILSQGSAVTQADAQTVQRTSGLFAPIIQLSGQEGELNTCKFSTSGDYIASGSFDRTIFLWNTYGECKNYNVLKGHSGAILEVDWSQDEKFIYSASTDKTVGVWDALTGERLKRMKGHQNIVNSVCASSTSNDTLVTSGDDNLINIWDIRTKGPVNTIEEKYQVIASCWSLDGNTVFSGGIDNHVKAWDIRTNALLYTLKGHTDTITCLRISPDGNQLLSNSMDNRVMTWNVKSFVSGERFNKCFEGAPHGFEKNLIKSCWSSDGLFIASGSGDRSVTIWNSNTQTIAYKLPGHKGCVNEVDWHPKEPIVLSCSNDKTMFLGEINPEEVMF